MNKAIKNDFVTRATMAIMAIAFSLGMLSGIEQLLSDGVKYLIATVVFIIGSYQGFKAKAIYNNAKKTEGVRTKSISLDGK